MQDQIDVKADGNKEDEKPLTIEDLNRMYSDAKSADKESTAEMRNNILLIAGEHYNKKNSDYPNVRGRSTSSQGPTSDNYRLRITKNWIHRAHRQYMAAILSQAPGATCTPRNPMEIQDQKAAELNQSVWEYAKSKYKLKAHMRDMVSDFCGIGECITLMKFDPNKGALKGYEQKVDEFGQPMFEQIQQEGVDPLTGLPVMQIVQGNPIPDESKPVFRGEFVFERVYGQNLFRDPAARQMKDAKWVGIERLEDTEELKKIYANDPKKKKFITDSSEDFFVFDSNKAGYEHKKGQTLLKEYLFKPCRKYRQGYFYLTTKEGILEEGPLPKGIWPLVWKGFDEHATRARATSMVKVARPWQAEINRASSQTAMHQVTVSEDKILYQAGTKVSQGALLPGVRGLTYQGAPPTILPGRSGEQYFQYIKMQEEEMQRALMIDMLDMDKTAGMDPMSALFANMQQSQKFSLYSEKFGEFEVEFLETFLELAKYYMPDDEVIGAIGRAEQINIEEFRNTSPLCYQIHVLEQNETIETKLGKQLVFNNILQYVGQKLEREDIGKLIADMPFGNWKDAFSDFTIDDKNVKNDFLAMERGEEPKISPSDNSDYCLRQVAKRKKERDFPLLPPFVQTLYAKYEQYHLQKKEQEAAALKQAQSEFIPTGGAMIACDMYVANSDPNKAPKRVRVPYQALEDLIQRLEKQGMGLAKMEQMNEAQAAEVAGMLLNGGQPQPGMAVQ